MKCVSAVRPTPFLVLVSLAVTLWSAILGSSVAAAETGEFEITRHQTPGGVEYGLWGPGSDGPSPILIMLAGTIDSTLQSAYFRQCGNELSSHGYRTVSIDIPCHGTQQLEGEPSGLSGWSFRAARESNFVAENNSRLSEVLDHLIQTQVADPRRIAVGGTSRGGFLALHFAAHDQRVACVVAFAPVTDPSALNEFTALGNHPFLPRINLQEQAEKLAGRPVWIVIGDQDQRVGTDQAIELAQAVTAASRKAQLDSRVTLHVMPEPRGHTTPRGSSELAAKWILAQIDPRDAVTTGTPPQPRQTVRDVLFVDDEHVLYRSGTERVFHPADLNPTNPVIIEDQPWEMAIGWTSVIRHKETGKYQLWYQAYAGGRDDRKSHKSVVCIAESDDGIQFTKPRLKIHDFKTEREPWNQRFEETNIVLLGSGGYGDRYANSVLYEPNAPDPAQRYKMLYTDFSTDSSGQEWPAVHAAFSSDGVQWTTSPANSLIHTAYGGRGLQPPFEGDPVYHEVWDARKNFLRKTWTIPLSMSDAIDVMFDPQRKKYAAYGKAWIQGPDGGLAWKHAMARIESADFLTWSKPVIVSSPDDFDPPNTEFHTSPVFSHKGVYFCLNQILSARGEAIGAKADAMHIELMISRDGIHWERPFRNQKFIAGTDQPFSNGGIFTNATPVILDDSIRFYYGGYNSGTIGGGAKLTDPNQQSGVGFASIPLDRFAGLRTVPVSAQSTLKKPLTHIGQVTLKPMSFAGCSELILNADAGRGSIRAELLNADGYRVRGYSKADAIPMTGNELRHSVSWQVNTIAELPPGEYMLRLHLDQSEVFALSVK